MCKCCYLQYGCSIYPPMWMQKVGLVFCDNNLHESFHSRGFSSLLGFIGITGLLMLTSENKLVSPHLNLCLPIDNLIGWVSVSEGRRTRCYGSSLTVTKTTLSASLQDATSCTTD